MAKEVILITGASGRIGFKSAEIFSDKYRIIGFDIILAGHLPDVEFYVVDMSSEASIHQGLEYVKKNYGNRIASVLHLAAYYSFEGGSWRLYENITVKGTERLLQGLQSFEVEQFIFSSTMLVHAPGKVGEPINEDSPVLPKWDYPKSKVLTEEIMHKERGKIPIVIMRIAGVYDDMCNSIPLSNQLQRIYQNQLEGHLFSGDITHGSSFVHMDDLVEAFRRAVEKRKELPPETVFLIGEPKTPSYDELQKKMAKLAWNKDWKTFRVPKLLAKIGAWIQDHLPFLPESFIKPWMIDLADDHYELDISRAKRLLGWEPKHYVMDTIPKWVEQLKNDPRTFYDKNKLKKPKKGFPQLP